MKKPRFTIVYGTDDPRETLSGFGDSANSLVKSVDLVRFSWYKVTDSKGVTVSSYYDLTIRARIGF
jgi:hypothetical protein